MESEAEPERALWRKVWEFPLVAMVVAAVLVVGTSIGIGLLFEGLPALLGEDLSVAVISLVTVAAVFALYKVVVRRLGRQKIDDLPLSGAAGDLGMGLAVGGALIALTVGIAALLGVYRIIGAGGFGDFVFIVFGGGLVAGFVEEVLFRGILFRWLEEMLGSWAALILSAALFGYLHISNDNATWFSSLAIALEAGILLGACYMIARTLWLPIGVHFAWNVVQGFVFDVPVSGHPAEGLVEAKLAGPELLTGGPFGLEASIIALMVAGGTGVWFTVRAARKGQVRPPMWVRRGED